MLLPFPVSLSAVYMTEAALTQHPPGPGEPDGCCVAGAGWCESSPSASGGSQALSSAGWSDALLRQEGFLGNSRGTAAITTLMGTFWGCFGVGALRCFIPAGNHFSGSGGVLASFWGGGDTGFS